VVEQGGVVLKMFGRQSDKVTVKRRPRGRGDTWVRWPFQIEIAGQKRVRGKAVKVRGLSVGWQVGNDVDRRKLAQWWCSVQ
jgi:hypothetical protein